MFGRRFLWTINCWHNFPQQQLAEDCLWDHASGGLVIPEASGTQSPIATGKRTTGSNAIQRLRYNLCHSYLPLLLLNSSKKLMLLVQARLNRRTQTEWSCPAQQWFATLVLRRKDTYLILDCGTLGWGSIPARLHMCGVENLCVEDVILCCAPQKPPSQVEASVIGCDGLAQ